MPAGHGDGADGTEATAPTGKVPATVIVIEITEIYTQCARAFMRAKTWSGQDESETLPTVGQILAEASEGEEGGANYDAEWAERAARTMW